MPFSAYGSSLSMVGTVNTHYFTQRSLLFLISHGEGGPSRHPLAWCRNCPRRGRVLYPYLHVTGI